MSEEKRSEQKKGNFIVEHADEIFWIGMGIFTANAIYKYGKKQGRIEYGRQLDKLRDAGYLVLTKPKQELVRCADQEWLRRATNYLKNNK